MYTNIYEIELIDFERDIIGTNFTRGKTGTAHKIHDIHNIFNQLVIINS